MARLIGTVEKGTRLAVGGTADGKAAVYAPAPATGQYSAAGSAAPFGSLGTNVRTAVADVNGDFIPDTVLVTGPGVPIRFAVVSGADNTTLLVPRRPRSSGVRVSPAAGS